VVEDKNIEQKSIEEKDKIIDETTGEKKSEDSFDEAFDNVEKNR